MGNDDAIAALIPIVTQVSGQIVTLTSEVGDLKGEIAAVKTTGEATLLQATKTNGRMTVAEANITQLQQAAAIEQHDEQLADKREAQDFAKQLAWRPLIASAGLGGLITVAGGLAVHFLFGVAF